MEEKYFIKKSEFLQEVVSVKTIASERNFENKLKRENECILFQLRYNYNLK